MTATRIGIAIVEHNGQFLVGTRPEGTVLADYAEFPGGKCKPDESPEECAVRECLEETGLAVSPVRLLEQTAWNYPHGYVELWFVACRLDEPSSAEPRPPFRWVPRAELASLRFPEANAGVLPAIKGEPRA